MQESKLLKSIAVAVVCFTASASIAAKDNEDLQGKSEKVAYADLNITKEVGVRQLYRRLHQASKRVCGVESLLVTGSVKEASLAKRCYRDSLDAAVVEIDNPLLTKVHKG